MLGSYLFAYNPRPMMFKREARTPEELQALFDIVVATADVIGDGYFGALVKSMAAALRVNSAFISVFTDSNTRMRVVALWNGTAFHDMGEYDITLSPCREVINGDVYLCPRDVRKRFPDDPQMKMLAAQSYRGVPMVGASGRHFGHIAAVDTRPIKAEPQFTSIMQICAMRAASEMERVRAENAIRTSERRLDAVLDSTRDAIVTIDSERVLRVVNKAAERMFGLSRDELVGFPLDPLLSANLLEELLRCTTCLADDRTEQACLWLRDGLTAVRADGTCFPIEASIAPVAIDGGTHFTLVMRNIDERLDAQAEIRRLMDRADDLAAELRQAQGVDEWIGTSPASTEVLRRLDLVASTDTTVLLTGESGTGKELAARLLHARSKRRERPLIKVDCASLPANLIETELFGHVKGAFTGAIAERRGRFELADGGTVFLDEIGELPLSLQAKLLRVLEEREFQRVGGQKTIRVDVRVIAATNRDLRAMVAERCFRDDLFFRLDGFPIRLPPLRERAEDVQAMAERFLVRFARRIGRPVRRITEEGLAALRHYPWPGNIRELKNVIERSVILSAGESLELDPSGIAGNPGAPGLPPTTLRDVERDHIIATLQRARGVIEGDRGAAAILDVHPSTLRHRMRKLEINRDGEGR